MAFRDRGFDLMRPWDGVSDDPRSLRQLPAGAVLRPRRPCAVPLRRQEQGPHRRTSLRNRMRSMATAGRHPGIRLLHSTSAELELVHDGPGDVLRYRASQIFWLYPTGSRSR